MNVFISYARADEPFLRSLLEHLALLRREGKIDAWHDLEIAAGEAWRGQIDQQLRQADLVLCLVSSAFVASDDCWDVELGAALARHERGEARVVPIIVRPVNWQSSALGELQALPAGGKPVASWDDTDAAWLDVEQGLRALLDARQPAPPAAAEPLPGPPSRKTLAALLVASVAFAALLIVILAKVPKATAVVVTAVVDELVLSVEPRPTTPFELLHPQLEVSALQWVGAASFAANLRAAGRVGTQPAADAAIGLRAAAGTSFRPRLRPRGETRLRLRPEGPGRLTATVESPAAWDCEVLPQAGLALRLRGVELGAGGGEPELEPGAKPIVFTGGAGLAADLGLRLVTAGEAVRLLDDELDVRAPTFFRIDAERDNERNFLRGGKIRFRDDALPDRQLESGSLLELRGDVSYRMKSLSLAGGELTVVLAGEPSGISLGASPDLMRELLPSTFLWLATHRLLLLAFSTLGGLLTLALMASKLLGWVKDG